MKKFSAIIISVIFMAVFFGCKTQIDPVHIHTFDEEKWERNEESHWHPSTCGCKDQKKDEEKHKFGDYGQADKVGNSYRYCTVCGYMDAVPKHEHIYTTKINDEGFEIKECPCGDIVTIGKHEHNFEFSKVDDE